MRKLETETLAKITVAFSGLAWGLFWLPIRALEQAGMSAFWSLMVFYLVPGVIVLPLFGYRWGRMVAGGRGLALIGFVTALPLVLYSVAVLNTDVIRAMMLFYLTPVWSTLLERAVFKQPIGWARWLAIAIAFVGMMVIFRADTGWPAPENIGDWAALAAGFGWSVSSVLLRLDRRHLAIDMFTQNFLWSALLMILAGLVLRATDAPAPGLVVGQLWWLAPTIVLVVMSGVYASMWGAPKLSPGLVGLLCMTEISAGAITAAIWAGESFGGREILGIALISLAGVFDSLLGLFGLPANQPGDDKVAGQFAGHDEGDKNG